MRDIGAREPRPYKYQSSMDENINAEWILHPERVMINEKIL